MASKPSFELMNFDADLDDLDLSQKKTTEIVNREEKEMAGLKKWLKGRRYFAP